MILHFFKSQGLTPTEKITQKLLAVTLMTALRIFYIRFFFYPATGIKQVVPTVAPNPADVGNATATSNCDRAAPAYRSKPEV